ncbi:MAG: domain S-box protein [Hyphomicrobiales bacterium]|nr:domain S-box protein [Hyphomicrobiales bacterium]
MRTPEGPSTSDLLDALDVGLIVLDRSSRITGWNAWMESASGRAESEVLGRRLADVFPDSLRPRLGDAVAQAFESGASSLLTHSLHPRLFALRTRAGGDLIHNVVVRPVGGKPYERCVLQIDDVTVSVSREQVLRKRQNARYDAVVNSASDPILTLDAETRIQLANPAASLQLGYSSAELRDRTLDVFLEDKAVWGEAWGRILKEGALDEPIEVVARRKDGTPSHLEISAARWLSNSRVFVTAILRDVNARHAAEEALRALNQTLEKRVAERTADRDRMWRLSSDIMMVAKLDGSIKAINPAWTELLGWREADLVEANFLDFVPEEDGPRFLAALAALSEDAAPRRFTLRLLSRAGQPRWIEWSAAAADDLLQAVGRDISAERETGEALRQAEEALRQSQKMESLGRLTGGIAHDFNNLLSGIIGSLDVMKRRLAKGRYDDLERFMEAAGASADRAASLTHRLLAFARRQPLDPRSIEINELVRGMADLLRRSLGEQIVMTTDLAHDLWPALTDAHQLENALLNIAINARDAMLEGGDLRIVTRNVEVGAPERHEEDAMEAGDYAMISISDTGTGMPPEVISKVFEPFFTTKPIGQGTGLGLSMIYGFAKQSRGHVRIESAEGKGTVVSLFIPRSKTAPVQELVATPSGASQGAGESVLVVEDDPSVRLLISSLLRELNYTAIEASDGQKAVPILSSDRPLHLMITDIGMPGMDGRKLADIARQHRPGLKILFVTGYAKHAVDRTFLGPGMDMATKPFSVDALALKIRALVEAPAHAL